MGTTEDQFTSDPVLTAFEYAKTTVREEFADYDFKISQNEFSEEQLKQELQKAWKKFESDNPQYQKLAGILLGILAVSLLKGLYNGKGAISSPAMADVIRTLIEWWIKTTSP